MKPEEEASKLAFDRFLGAHSKNSTIVWKTEENDPPDYWLHLDGQVFAVEVTRIMETREIGSEKIPLIRAVNFLRKLAKEAENEIKDYWFSGV